VVPDPEGGFALPLAQGRIRILPAEPDEPACIAAITVRTTTPPEPATIGRTILHFR
jgi:hypothetical protein